MFARQIAQWLRFKFQNFGDADSPTVCFADPATDPKSEPAAEGNPSPAGVGLLKPTSTGLLPKATGLPKDWVGRNAQEFVQLAVYLATQGNAAEDILKCFQILSMNSVILEIGCGGGEAARAITAANPDIGVIATDKYDFSSQDPATSHYCRMALSWQKKELNTQAAASENLVILRAEADMLHFVPDHVIDTLLMVNPEPSVGKAVLEFLAVNRLTCKIKPGDCPIVVKPYSRDMGVMASGGLEFDHGEDWSRGLGFLFESPYAFAKAGPEFWSVNINRLSPYSKNSTQQNVYVCKNLHALTAEILPQAVTTGSSRI